jgi:NAD(P)-dependent dehydrogenase (short-subunit alcohol dehydrogenase family)
MTHGRFGNPVEAALTGIKDLFRAQPLAQALAAGHRLDGKTCLVTGASSGLGFAIAMQLAQRGARLLLACRSGIPVVGQNIQKACPGADVQMLRVDLSDLRSVDAFCTELETRGERLDVVVCNAGVAPPRARQTPQGLDEMFVVNYLATFYYLNRFLDRGVLPNRTLCGSATPDRSRPRVIIISSDSHQNASPIDWQEFGKFRPHGVRGAISNYSYFKLILNTFATELARRFTDGNRADVSVHVTCPGPVNTNIARDAPLPLRMVLKMIFTLFFRSPRKAAGSAVYLATAPEIEGQTNLYLHMLRHKRMDAKCYVPEAGAQLWLASATLLDSVYPRR